MPLFITPTTEWPSMVFFICLSIYFYNFGFMHCLKHSMRLWPVHSRNSTSVRPCTYRWSPDPVWSLSLTLSPQFPPRTVKLSTQNFSITPFSGLSNLNVDRLSVQVYLRYKFNRCTLYIIEMIWASEWNAQTILNYIIF